MAKVRQRLFYIDMQDRSVCLTFNRMTMMCTKSPWVVKELKGLSFEEIKLWIEKHGYAYEWRLTENPRVT